MSILSAHDTFRDAAKIAEEVGERIAAIENLSDGDKLALFGMTGVIIVSLAKGKIPEDKREEYLKHVITLIESS